MKKVSFWLLVGMLCLLFSTCKKNSATFNSSETLISNAKAYFLSRVGQGGGVNLENYRAMQPKTLSWDQAYVVTLSVGKRVVVPVQFRNVDLGQQYQ